jgi:hypothetical protein
MTKKGEKINGKKQTSNEMKREKEGKQNNTKGKRQDSV